MKLACLNIFYTLLLSYLFAFSDLIVNDALISSKIIKTLPISPQIFHTPLIVICSECSTTYLPLLLETIIRQPEMNVSNVFLAYDPLGCESVRLLEHLFRFRIYPISDLARHSLDRIIAALPLTEYQQYIIIEDTVVLSSDFLTYFGQLIPIIHSPAPIAVSGWNENGVSNISDDTSLVYKAVGYPLRYAFMVPKEFNLTGIILNTLLDDFNGPDGRDLQIIIPDVSRVYYANERLIAKERIVCM